VAAVGIFVKNKKTKKNYFLKWCTFNSRM